MPTLPLFGLVPLGVVGATVSFLLTPFPRQLR